ncbi:unnamed protein product [Onchocerca flexuosa]|uniref:Uncharacterized protein n=1 Tax=Onchocerca flexuosa TaxID=387005 RepID=A0A183I494_9BILA|nr:unnamed protein product [Onchocerca flexuosa]
MELSGSNDANLITNDISDSMISIGALTDTNITNFTSTDCVPPRKRPKRLSISCVERGKISNFDYFDKIQKFLIKIFLLIMPIDN